MDTVTYPDKLVGEILSQYTVPVRLNILKERDQAKAMRAIWTPTVIFLDQTGREHHRILGYHPPREFAAVVTLAAGLCGFATGRSDDALPCFERIVKDFGDTQLAPEATYWRGVCNFKRSKSTTPIYEACKEIVAKYPNSFWAKKIGFVTRYQDFNLS